MPMLSAVSVCCRSLREQSYIYFFDHFGLKILIKACMQFDIQISRIKRLFCGDLLQTMILLLITVWMAVSRNFATTAATSVSAPDTELQSAYGHHLQKKPPLGEPKTVGRTHEA